MICSNDLVSKTNSRTKLRPSHRNPDLSSLPTVDSNPCIPNFQIAPGPFPKNRTPQATQTRYPHRKSESLLKMWIKKEVVHVGGGGG